jgi:hypothetical protein
LPAVLAGEEEQCALKITERGLDAFGAAKTWERFSVYSSEYKGNN